MKSQFSYDYLIIGAGFAGLTLALRLTEAGKSVAIVEQDGQVGGLAADFSLENGSKLERFYHHWFNSDTAISALIRDLGLSEEVREYPSHTGMYFNKKIWDLSSPWDLIKFKPLKFHNRIRLGFATLLVRGVKDYKKIEGKSIREWLEPLCGKQVYSVVWEPLIRAKFSIFAEEVSAAWMWKKLVLRGSTRSKSGSEMLLYIDGGFGRLAQQIAKEINARGGEIHCGEKIINIKTNNGEVVEVESTRGSYIAPKKVIFTGAPSQLADLMSLEGFSKWKSQLQSVKYLANICLVLLLDRSLSETYWLNVNDPGFPFVGVIEHTNLVSDSMYQNLHVVYLSRYIEESHEDYLASDSEYFMKSLESLAQMFPDFQPEWIKEKYIWRARYAQPITTRNYSQSFPNTTTPFSNLILQSMSQIYPEDRGTNYAVKSSEKLATLLLSEEK
jgi:protoporphyrinogen oxidase